MFFKFVLSNFDNKLHLLMDDGGDVTYVTIIERVHFGGSYQDP